MPIFLIHAPPGFPLDGTGYSLAFRDPATGAMVLYPEGWQPANTTELQIARNLADSGFDVVFRVKSVGYGATTPDADVRTPTGWESWEFKTISLSVTNLRGRIQADLRDGS